jgi:hypothetical protein
MLIPKLLLTSTEFQLTLLNTVTSTAQNIKSRKSEIEILTIYLEEICKEVAVA